MARINGVYSTGCGKAHLSSSGHTPIFGKEMVGTFNVRTRRKITDFPPTIVSEEYGRRYWRIMINGQYEAWAFRWNGSRMPYMTWELVSEQPLPDELKLHGIIIDIGEDHGK